MSIKHSQMNRIITSLFLIFIFNQVAFSQCGTCSLADCSIVGPKTGATAAADLTTDMQNSATISANAFYVDGDKILFKNGPYTFKNCYIVNVTSSSQTLGLKLSTVIMGSNPTYSGVLYTGSNSCSTPITPTRTNVAGGSSGFNPEWDGLAPGTYTYCLTVTIPSGSSMNSIMLGYYLSGTASPTSNCSDCATAACDIAGPYADFTTANGAAQCNKKVFLSTSVASPASYTSYYKVTTATTATSLGIIISNGTGKIDGSLGNCPASTRVATLYPAGSNCSTGTVGSATSNVTNFYNVEWSGLTANTPYIIKVVTTAPSGCQIQDQCASYYSPTSTTPVYQCQPVDFYVSNVTKITNYTFNCSDPIDTLIALDPPSAFIPDQWIYPGFILYIKPQTGTIWGNSNTIDLLFNGVSVTTNNVLTDLLNVGSTNVDPYVNPITFAQPGTFAFKVNGIGASSSKKFDYIVYNAADGTIADQGTIDKTKTITLAKNPVGTAHFSGPGVTDDPNNGGKGLFDPKLAGAGTHTITYTWDNGTGGATHCTGSKSITVTVNGGPSISGTLTACVGATTQLSGTQTPASSNAWVSSNTAVATVSNTGLVTGVSAGTVTITYTNSTGCSAQKDVVISPTPTITGTLTACIGNTSQLTGSGTAAASNAWVSATVANATISTTGLVTGAGVAGGASVITYTDVNGCKATKTFTSYALPAITGTTTVCVGKTTQLTATTTAAASNAWVSSSQSNATVDATGLVTGVLAGNSNITYTNTNGCKATKQVTVSNKPIIAGATSVCVNSAISLTPSSGGSWSSSDLTKASVAVGGTVTGVSATTPSPVITYTDANGCSNTVTITVNAKPTVTVPTDASYCAGATVPASTFTSTPTGATFAWSNSGDATIGVLASGVGSINSFTALNATAVAKVATISVTPTLSGCVGTAAPYKITVNPIVKPSIACGTSTSSSVTFDWSPGLTGATNYTLSYDKGAGSVSLPSQAGTTYNLTGLSTTQSATITVTPTGTGCFASNTQSCTADNCPSPTITSHPTAVTKCAGLSATFSVVSNPTTNVKYEWYKSVSGGAYTLLSDGGVYSGATTKDLSISDNTGLDGTSYKCRVTETTTGLCFKESNPALLTVNPIPNATPTVAAICDGDLTPKLSYTNLVGSPDKVVVDLGFPIPAVTINMTASPVSFTLPMALPISGSPYNANITLKNTTTNCTSSLIPISLTIQPINSPSISANGTTVSSVSFAWSELSGLQSTAGGTDVYSVKEYVCASCATPGTYVTPTSGTFTLAYDNTLSKWVYTRTGLNPGDIVYIEVTPVDNTPLATPSCYKSSIFNLTATPCTSPIITQDIADVSLCDGTLASPVSTSFEVLYNSADASTPCTWEVLSKGSSTWSSVANGGVYAITGSTNVNSKLTISSITGLDGNKYRLNIKTATSGGTCDLLSTAALLTVKPLPVASAVTDIEECPNVLVPALPATYTPLTSTPTGATFDWTSDVQTTGVKASLTGVSNFESFTTKNSDLTDRVSIITVTPKLNGCTGSDITFKVTVRPTVTPVIATPSSTDITTNSVTFNWTSNGNPASYHIDTAKATTPTVTAPTAYKPVSPSVTLPSYTFSNMALNQKAFIKVTPEAAVGSTAKFCPASAIANAITYNCTPPATPVLTSVPALCEGSQLSITVPSDPALNYQWKVSTDAGANYNNVSTTDYGTSGTSNTLQASKTVIGMNATKLVLVVTDKTTGCSSTSNAIDVTINPLPTATVSSAHLVNCIDDTPGATVNFVGNTGTAPYTYDYTINGTATTGSTTNSFEEKTDVAITKVYALTGVTDSKGCKSTITGQTATVIVNPNPEAKFTVTPKSACVPFTVNFTDISTNQVNNKVTWDFGNGDDSPAIHTKGVTSTNYKIAGDYGVRLIVEDQNGCFGESAVDSIHAFSPPVAKLAVDKTVLNVYDRTVSFTSKYSTNAKNFKWTFGDGSKSSYLADVTYEYPDTSGIFKVTLLAYNTTDCYDVTTTLIEIPEAVIYYIPNTFTPNGDENNNTFQPVFHSGYDPQHYEFTIFDRWGQIVFESHNPAVGWDGTYGDKILGDNTFVWKLGFKEKMTDKEHHATGHVNLVK